MANGTEPCVERGLLLPKLGDLAAIEWVQAIAYLLFLLYLFLGIAIIADIFMCSIERITSKTKKYLISPGDANTAPEYVEIRWWNDTVANLTLMALGSSAPEILLAIIEIVGNDFKAGKLGPGTIVGSAAFNLLVISAVCVVSIPKNETKRINGISVFVITASFSVFAYFWLFLILTKITPDIVEIWEAFLTLFFFVILVVISYIADKNFFRRTDAKADTEMDSFNGKIFAARQRLVLGAIVSSIGAVQKFFPKGKLTKKNLARFVKEVRRVDPSITEEDAACLAATYLFENEHHSRLFYRVSACRALTGSKTPFPHLNDHLQQVYDHLKSGDGSTLQIDGGKEQFFTKEAEKAYEEDIAVVQFSAPTAVVLENVGSVEIVLERFGKMDNTFDCIVETLDRTAKSGKDYKPLKEKVTFGPNEAEKKLYIEIIDDNNWNPDNVFLVKLSLPETESEEGEVRKDVHKGRICMMTVTIIDDDNPGIIAFGQRLITVEENAGKVVIPILREQGADGEVLVKWKTTDGTAKNGVDFQGGEGEVLFEHGVIREEIEIPIVNDYDEFKDEYFEVTLVSASNNAKIGKNNHLMVTVTNDDDYNAIMGRLMKKVRKDRKGFHIHREKWVEQFKAAMVVPGSEGGEEGEEGVSQPSTLDYVLHVFSFGWKILFAFVPPTSMWGGYLTFIVSLVVIGFITCIVGDTAEAFGCLCGLKDEVTAITLVALGTSLPDTFASRTAARMERYADNAIGNITGSNSVNVFLGLGLPWFIAAIVWHVRGVPFEVKAGTLGFNVGLYTGLSLIAIAILMARRTMSFFGKAELGGPPLKAKTTAIFLVFLWFIYIIVSSLQVYGKIKIN